MCVRESACVYTYTHMYLEARKQLAGTRSYLLPGGSLETNSDCQTWEQIPLSAEPSSVLNLSLFKNAGYCHY